ncbi:MAG: hypothetical protein ACFFDK_01880 [Promethearchaeota archaeon]
MEDFYDYKEIEPLIIRLNKFISKEKIVKIQKTIKQLENLLEESDFRIPITYILSILAENYIELISSDLINKLEPFLKAKNEKLKVNSIIILGFYILGNANLIKKYFSIFIQLLIDDSEDVKDNAHYFLHEFVKESPTSIYSHVNILLDALKLEKKKENIISLLHFLQYINELDFKQLYRFRESAKELMQSDVSAESPEILKYLEILFKRFFPSLKEIDFRNLKTEDSLKLLDGQFLMKKLNISEIAQEKNMNIKNLLEKIKKSRLKDVEIYFYIKDKKKNEIYFYELEKNKLYNIFNTDNKISYQKLKETFSQIIENDSELELFIATLLNLNLIKGYISKFNFYPYEYLKSDINNQFLKKGHINIKKQYDFLPASFVHDIIADLNQEFLMGTNLQVYYSLKKIIQQINRVAANNSVIDLKSYRQKLLEQDFIKLIKNLPRDYLTNFHKGTSWLTNIGRIRVEDEINNSKLIGFIDMIKISEKLKINKLLLMDILTLNIDPRSGIWDKNKEIFYFSKYLNSRIEEINRNSDETSKKEQINKLAEELNIDIDHILSKIDENLKSIGEEIKSKDEINILEYTEKTGMNYDVFFSFINELGLNYFIKGDQLILSPKKIEEAKNNIKYNLIDRAKSAKLISLGNFGINSDLIKELISELKKDGKLQGIFHEEAGEIVFYTLKGIRDLMLENSFLFSFEDLFYGKELNEDEISLLKELLENLIKERKLKGTFDIKTNTFSSEELLFEFDYNTVIDDFRKVVNKHIKKFTIEFQKIKQILSKQDETIFPQEIKIIQDTIDRINLNYVKWRAQLNAYVIEANKKLLQNQGFSFKRYQNLPAEKKNDVKIFKEDPDVYELLDKFEQWVKVFNEIEQNYGKIIFLQKRLINNPEDKEAKNNLNELLVNLSLNS